MKDKPREHEGRADEVAPESSNMSDDTRTKQVKEGLEDTAKPAETATENTDIAEDAAVDDAAEKNDADANVDSEENPAEESDEALEDDQVEDADQDSKNSPDAKRRRKRRLIWSASITGALVLLGVGAWYFGLYQRIHDYYNAASISFKVREDETFVLEGASLMLNGKTYTTDANGKVVVDSIIAGSYNVEVSKDGYYPTEETLQIKRGDNDLKIFSLKKLPAKLYSIKGYVFDSVSEKPIADAQVTMGAKTVRTAPSGEYVFDKLVPGTYKVTITRTGYTDKDVAAEVSAADIVQPEVTLVPVGQVIFVSNRDGKRGLYSSNYDGSNQQKLVQPQNGGEDYAPVMSPDGKWVAFSSTREGTKSNYGSSLAKLYIVSRDGKDVRKLNDDVSHSELRWSSNSRFLYYGAYTDKALTQFVRRVYDLSRKTTFDFSENIGAVQFSPNGNQLAYAFQVQVALPTPTPTPTPSPSTSPYPSPTPTPVTTYEWHSRVNVIDLTNGQRTQVTDKVASYINQLSYSADSGTLYYEAMLGSEKKRYQYVVKSGAESEVSLPANPETRRFVYSPSGTKRAYLEARDGKTELYLSDASGGNEMKLTNIGTANVNYLPIWDPSGSYIIFTVSSQSESAYYIVAVAGGGQKKVVDILADNNTADYIGF